MMQEFLKIPPPWAMVIAPALQHCAGRGLASCVQLLLAAKAPVDYSDASEPAGRQAEHYQVPSPINADAVFIGVRDLVARGYVIPGGASQRGGGQAPMFQCRTLSDPVRGQA